MSVTINGTSGLVFNDASTQNTAAKVGMVNRIINGDCRIDQRNAGASVTLNSGAYVFPVDRFTCLADSDGTMTAQQSTDAPTGFANSIKFTTTVADASLGANQFLFARQNIEGFNTTDLGFGTANAKTVTLSFWVKSSLTGTFGGSLQNTGVTRAYPFTYTITAANTWEQKSVTIAGDTSGTWNITNGIGLAITFGLGGGSNYSGTAGSWQDGNFNNATGATSVVGTSGATFYITGVQLEKGSTATSFDYRPYGTELALCQRYCEVIIAQGNNAACWPIQNGSTTNARGVYSFKVQKRAAPTFTNVAGTLWLVQNYLGNFTPSAVNQAAANPSGTLIDATCTGLTQGLASIMLEGSTTAGQNMCIFTAEL